MDCNDNTKPIGVLLISSKYNYRAKVAKAMEEGNTKYIKMLFKKGKISYLKYD